MSSRWGIGRHLLVLILLFSSLITLVLTLTQLYLDYRRDVSAIEQRFTEIQNSYVESLTTSLWNMDRTLLTSQLEGVVRLPDMIQATVTETVVGVRSNLTMTAGSKDNATHLSREFPLIYKDRDRIQQIGVLKVQATLAGVYSRLIDKAVVILVSQGVKTFIVSLFILFIIHRIVTRHLVGISNFLSRLDAREIASPLTLDRKQTKHRDELDQVVVSFNALQERLTQVVQQLQESNEELEFRVEERTRSLQDQIIEREAVERSLRDSQERFRDIAETASNWFWEMGKDLTFTFISRRFSDITGLPQEKVLGKTRTQLIDEEVLEIDDAEALWQRVEKYEPFQDLEGRVRGEHGVIHHIQIGGKPFFGEDGAFLGYRGAGRDITARKVAEEALRRSHDELELRIESRTAELRKLSQAVEQSPVSVIITDTEANIEYVNQAFLDKTGYLQREVLGKKPSILKSETTHESVYRELWGTITSGRDWSGEFLNKRKNGSTMWVRAYISPVKNAGGVVTHYLAIEEDVTLRKSQEQRILYQAQYDSLTDLPNRLLAVDRLNQAIKMAHREKCRVAVMFVDLDDFKKVNDTLGHDVGDRLLVEASRRLEGTVRDGDTVARQGGDEFLVILAGAKKSEDAEVVAQKILTAFASPFTVDGIDLVVTPSIGLSLYPDDGYEAAVLLRNADAAMYRAKDEGRNGYHFFTTSMNEEALRRLGIERHLRHALDRNELRVVYQPIVETRTRRIVGAEALLRWDNKELGSVGPDQFIPVAEQTGIIVPIGRWVATTACAQLVEWNARYGLNLQISVNVSPRQFRDKSFVDTVQSSFESGLSPALFEIEVTEGFLLNNQPETLQFLADLKAMGVRLSMDDFGTGYSSLSYLKTLPFDRLKIDQSFVRDIAVDRDDLALVTAAITMAKSLGLEVVGEGVETEEQFRILTDLGCDFLQGYLFARPLSAEKFDEHLISQLP